MKSMTVDTVIDAPVEFVWNHASDLRGWPETMSAITKVEVLTDGPIGVGTVFQETRVMFGREATEEMTISKFDAPHRMGFDAMSSGTKYYSEMRFEPVEGGKTRAVVEFNAEPQSMVAKVLGAVLAPMMKGSMCKAIEGDLADCKAAVEARLAGAQTAEA